MCHSSTVTLHLRETPLNGRLSLGSLREFLQKEGADPVWISLEPRPWLGPYDGKWQVGRLAGLYPLLKELPQGYDALPLLTASLFTPRRWWHFFDAHPLSGIEGRILAFALDPFEGSTAHEGLRCQNSEVLSWKEHEKRFGLNAPSLPEKFHIEHYDVQGKRLTWRIVP